MVLVFYVLRDCSPILFLLEFLEYQIVPTSFVTVINFTFIDLL